MALGGRIADHSLLNNLQRAQIVAAVRARPGMHLREAQRATSLAWGEFIYHARLLQRASVLRMHSARGRTHLFLAGESCRAPDETLGASARRILATVASEGGSTSTEIAAAVGISLRLARYHVRRLVERGAMVSDEGRPHRYWATGVSSEADALLSPELDARHGGVAPQQREG